MPPSQSNAITVCEPMNFSFRALFGPFVDNQCGTQQVINFYNLTSEFSQKQLQQL